MDIELVNIPPSEKVNLQKWAKFTIDKWQFSLVKFKKLDTRTLINSFTASVIQEAGNNKALISFAFEYYLKMIEMGVGKGVKYGEHKEVRQAKRAYGVKGKSRKPFPVYSRILYAEIHRLAELLANQYAQSGARIIVDEFKHGSADKTVL